ncbi:MAG: TRAP transporter small permease, partial [bacterium]|nr:TRAP transporter small permease [bacterium]
MDRLSELTKSVAEWIAVGLFAAVLVLQTLNITFRYSGIVDPWMWVEEFSTFAFIWILFLLWHVADREGAHFTVDFLVAKLSPRRQLHVKGFAHAVSLLFALLVIWASAAFLPTTMLYTTNSFDWLPMGVIYLVIPVGLALVAMEQVRALVKIWRGS